MELTFNETAGNYIATAVVNADFNLHVELEEKGHVILRMTTVEGSLSALKAHATLDGEKVYDEDFDAIVYPKYVTVRCTGRPKCGYITEVS